jgi:hypothetical protein
VTSVEGAESRVSGRAWLSLSLRLARELAVIVLGVSVALWAENWRQAREERRLESLYLARLVEDFIVNERTLQTILTESRETANAAREVLAFLNSPAGSPVDTMAVLNAVAFAALMRDLSLTSATYDELVSSGRLTLIRDTELRAALVNYNLQAARRTEFFDEAPTELRSFVNRTLPPGFTREAQQCGMVSRGTIPASAPCAELSLTPEESARSLDALRSAAELRGYLAEAVWYARHIELPFLTQYDLNSALRHRLQDASRR